MKESTKFLIADIASHEARIVELQTPQKKKKGSKLWPTEADKLNLIEMYRKLITEMKRDNAKILGD